MNHENTIQASACKSSSHRDSNIELFRIIAMFFIVAHHYVVNSGLTLDGGPIAANPLSANSIFLLLFGAWGKIGINCFVMITGYFMCKSSITLKKFVKLLGEILFYKIGIGLIFLITGYEPISLKFLVKTFIPVNAVETNFIGCYILFFLFIPFLNILIRNITEKQHILLLLLCGFTYVFFGTVKRMPVSMNYVSWFMVLYVIASYIRMYPKHVFSKTKLWGILTAVSIVLCSLSVVCCAWLSFKLHKNIWYFFVTDSNTFLAVLVGVCAFLFFKNVKIKYNAFLNAVAATTFGILMIHANCDAMRRFLWQDVCQNVKMYDSQFMPLIAIGCVCAVFCVCSFIDWLRIQFLEKPFMKKVALWEPKVIAWWHKKEDRIGKRFNIK